MLADRDMPAKYEHWAVEPARSKTTYFVCGFVVGMILTAGAVRIHRHPSALRFLLIAVGAVAFGAASARWGDKAWLWLSDWLRWPL